MSFQYINPIYLQNNQSFVPYAQNQHQMAQNSYVQNFYMQNPYSASFYNQGVQFPYNNPAFAPKISAEYSSLGQIRAMNGENVHLFQLKNGHKVAIVPTKDKATIVKTFVDAGSINETDPKRGVMHAIEHSLFKGSSKLKDGDVFKYTAQMGASTNASTDYAKVDYYITAPYMDKQNLDKTIQIQGDMVYNPKFENGAIESEKGPICSEISMINDDISTVAFDKVVRNLFQIQSKSQNLVAGSIDTVQNLNQQDFYDYHQNYYSPNNMYTVVVGDVDVNSTIDEISKNFKSENNVQYNKQYHSEALTPLLSPKREDIRSSKTNYTTAYLAFSGPKQQDSKEFVISKMLDYYMSQCSTSYLKNSLEQIDGDYASSMQKVGLNQNDPYAMMSVMGLNPSDEQKGLDIFYDAIYQLQTKPLSDDDMQAMINFAKKDAEYMMSDSEAICDMLGSCFLDNSMDLVSDYKQIAQSITKQDIMDFARKYYDLNKVSIVVVHPTTVSEEEINQNYDKSKYSLALQNKTQQIAFTGAFNVNTKNIREYELKNNTHLALNNSKSNICAFNWTISTPPIKPKNPNIPAVLAYIFQKGSQYLNQSQLERFMELNGIDADVAVNPRRIEINANCMVEGVDKTLALMNELMYNPKITQSDFEDAKKYVKNALKASQKDANSNMLDKMYPGYFPTISQKLQTIDELKLDDVKEFYSQMLNSASSNFIATAPIDNYPSVSQSVIDAQNNSNGIKFKDYTPKLSPMFEAQNENKVIVDTDDLNQAQIYQSYKFPFSRNIHDEAKFELVNMILGGSPNSRLFSDLREKQNLAYSVSSNIQSFENTGILTFKIQTTTDNPQAGIKSYENVQKSLEGFKSHADKLCAEYVTDEELSAAKMKLKQAIVGQMQHPLSETELLSMNMLEPFGIQRIDKYVDAIDSVTKEDIKTAANFIFSNKSTTSILASPDTINSQMPYLQTLGTVSNA